MQDHREIGILDRAILAGYVNIIESADGEILDVFANNAFYSAIKQNSGLWDLDQEDEVHGRLFQQLLMEAVNRGVTQLTFHLNVQIGSDLAPENRTHC